MQPICCCYCCCSSDRMPVRGRRGDRRGRCSCSSHGCILQRFLRRLKERLYEVPFRPGVLPPTGRPREQRRQRRRRHCRRTGGTGAAGCHRHAGGRCLRGESSAGDSRGPLGRDQHVARDRTRRVTRDVGRRRRRDGRGCRCADEGGRRRGVAARVQSVRRQQHHHLRVAHLVGVVVVGDLHVRHRRHARHRQRRHWIVGGVALVSPVRRIALMMGAAGTIAAGGST